MDVNGCKWDFGVHFFFGTRPSEVYVHRHGFVYQLLQQHGLRSLTSNMLNLQILEELLQSNAHVVKFRASGPIRRPSHGYYKSATERRRCGSWWWTSATTRCGRCWACRWNSTPRHCPNRLSSCNKPWAKGMLSRGRAAGRATKQPRHHRCCSPPMESMQICTRMNPECTTWNMSQSFPVNILVILVILQVCTHWISH